MSLKALLVLAMPEATWAREIDLPFAPFPSLGIRVDVYEVLNVESVVVGDLGYDVTCIVTLEGTEASEITEEKCESLGFELRGYP